MKTNWKTIAKNLTLISAAWAALVGLWISFQLPIPALSEDIDRLDKQQTRTAIKANRNERRDYASQEIDVTQRLYEQKALPSKAQNMEYIGLLESNKAELKQQIQELDQEVDVLRGRLIEIDKK